MEDATRGAGTAMRIGRHLRRIPGATGACAPSDAPSGVETGLAPAEGPRRTGGARAAVETI